MWTADLIYSVFGDACGCKLHRNQWPVRFWFVRCLMPDHQFASYSAKSFSCSKEYCIRKSLFKVSCECLPSLLITTKYTQRHWPKYQAMHNAHHCFRHCQTFLCTSVSHPALANIYRPFNDGRQKGVNLNPIFVYANVRIFFIHWGPCNRPTE